jgi:hypothetical protein
VQTFYDWYQSGSSHYRLWRLMTSGSKYLDPGLANILSADSVLGLDPDLPRNLLDFDPVLDSQDPCPHYEVTQVRRQEGDYRVTVRPVCPTAEGQRLQTTTPIVELVPVYGSWRIINIWYPEPEQMYDLKSTLCKAGGFPKGCSDQL